MEDLDLVAAVVAAVAAFVVSGAYYVVLGDRLAAFGSPAAAQERPSPWLVPIELVRGLLVAAVVAWLVAVADVGGLGGAVGLALALWIGFPVVLLAGSVFHEKVPMKLAALHAGDWLLKLLAIASIVALWP